MVMTQDEKWLARYDEVMEFIKTNKRNYVGVENVLTIDETCISRLGCCKLLKRG